MVLSVLKKELKDMLRDRRTIIMSVVIPMILLPALLIGAFYFAGRQEEELETEPLVIAYQGEETFSTFYQSLPLTEIKQLDPERAVQEREVEVGLRGEKSASGYKISLYFDLTNPRTSGRLERVREILRLFDEHLAAQEVEELGGAPEEVLHPLQVEDRDLTPPGGVFRFMLSTFLPLVIVVYGIAANAYLGADIGAGEKERGTWEALLSLPVRRTEIALGKSLALSSLGFLTVLIMLLATLVVTATGVEWFWPPEAAAQASSSLNLGAGFFPLVILAGLFLSLSSGSLTLALSVFSRNIREAQLYISYLPMALIIPLLIINITAVSSGNIPSWSYFIPMVNVYSLIRDLLLGSWKPLLGSGVLLSNLLFSGAALYFASAILQRESVILRK